MADLRERLAAFDAFARDDEEAARQGRRYVVLDVFSATPLQGNQLAVFLDGQGLSGGLMQQIAREMNLSETVFLLPSRSEADLRVRIFTPASELPFAGHPVLGSAIVAAAALEREAVTLETERGPVPVRIEQTRARGASATMEQPIPTWAPFGAADELLAALGVERSLLPVEIYTNGPRHVYVALESEQAVARLDPDQRALHALGEVEANCFAGSARRWKTRMFAPALGVAEDPATGSAAGPLAVHLARHGEIAFGEQIEIRQGAEIGRPSLLLARAEGSRERVERVEVGGSAVIVASGELRL